MTSNQIDSMPDISSIEKLLNGGAFKYKRLAIEGIDNEPVFARNAPGQREEEICLFHDAVST